MGSSSAASDSEASSVMRVDRKDLTDDVWYEIFIHLPLDSIFKLKSVSKVWLTILSNPNFINKWYKLNALSLPWGFVGFRYSVAPDDNNKLSRRFTVTCPDSCSQFISGFFSFNFLISNFPNTRNEQGPKNLFLMGSSNGLVLCNIQLSDHSTYCVCNPLTQKWVSLPPPPSRIKVGLPRDITGLMSSDKCFKVIRIPKFEGATKQFKVEVFSSELGEWNVYDVSCPRDVSWGFHYFVNVITHKGVLYWLQKTNKQLLAISGNVCRLIDLPDQAMDVHPEIHHHLGESEGSICYALVNAREKNLSVWVLKEDWCLLYKDNEFRDMLAEMETLPIGGFSETDLITEIQILGFHPFDKNVVILSYESYDKYIWAYNTRTKGYEQLSHPSFLGSNVFSPCMSIFIFALKPWPTVLPPISW